VVADWTPVNTAVYQNTKFRRRRFALVQQLIVIFQGQFDGDFHSPRLVLSTRKRNGQMLAFCGPLAVERSISIPNFGLNPASSSFLSSARAGIPTTITPSFLASCRLLSHSFFQSNCACAVRVAPQDNRPKSMVKSFGFVRRETPMCLLFLRARFQSGSVLIAAADRIASAGEIRTGTPAFPDIE
jgi:hypothetical protein